MYFKFKENDLYVNRIKAHPRVNFFIHSGTTYYNNKPNLSRLPAAQYGYFFNGSTAFADISDVAPEAHTNVLNSDFSYSMLIKGSTGSPLSFTNAAAGGPFVVTDHSTTKARYRVRANNFVTQTSVTTAEDVYDDQWHLITWGDVAVGDVASVYYQLDGGSVVGPDADTYNRSVMTTNWQGVWDRAYVGSYNNSSLYFSGTIAWVGIVATDILTGGGHTAMWTAFSDKNKIADLKTAFTTACGATTPYLNGGFDGLAPTTGVAPTLISSSLREISF